MAAEKAVAFEIDFKENAVPAPTNVKERFETKPLKKEKTIEEIEEKLAKAQQVRQDQCNTLLERKTEEFANKKKVLEKQRSIEEEKTEQKRAALEKTLEEAEARKREIIEQRVNQAKAVQEKIEACQEKKKVLAETGGPETS